MRFKAILTIICLVLLFLPASPAGATPATLNIDGTVYTFTLGNGSDGNVIFRRNPGNPSQGQMLVNGVVVATSSVAETILGNIFQTQTTAFSVIRFDIEDIVHHLPVNRTYSPGTFYAQPGATAPSLGSVPNFRNLTIGEGIMLRARTRALAFKVLETLTVEGILATAHGAGGHGGTSASPSGRHGLDASGDIIVYAGSITVAPNGTTPSRGAFMAGWGGGGGGAHSTGIPGNGGRGGSLIIYTHNLTVTSEIRAGNGGGGGGAGFNASRTPPGGSGGAGGFLALFAGNINSNVNAVFASGYGGGGGGGFGRTAEGSHSPSHDGSGGGGYGGGGGGTHSPHWHLPPVTAGSGGSAGSPGGPFPRPEPSPDQTWANHIGFGGSSGRDGAGNHGGSIIMQQGWWLPQPWFWHHNAGGMGGGGGGQGAAGVDQWPHLLSSHGGSGGPSGTVVIRSAGSLTGEPHVITGYLSGGAGANRGWESKSVTVNQDAQIRLFTLASANMNIRAGRDIVIRGASTNPTMVLHAGRNLTVNGGTLNISSGNIVNDFNFNGGALGTVGLTVGGNAHLRGDYTGAVNLTVTGDTRFLGNANYRLDDWWTARNVTVNGLRIRGVTPAAAPNIAGVIEVSLTDWVGRYNTPPGTRPSLEFRIERKLEGETEWTANTPVLRSLTGFPSWTDTRTVIGKNAVYTAGFRIPGSVHGFIFIDENATVPVMSEGGGLDETPPVISFFSVANDRRNVSESNVSVRVSAQDNRTAQANLKIQITVNDTPYHYQNSAFVQGNNWSSFIERMDGLPLDPGENEIVLKVRDESMNSGQAIRFVFYQAPGEPAALSPPVNWLQPVGGNVSITSPAGPVISATFQGGPAYFVPSERAVLSFTGLPPNIRFVQVSLDNVAWSEHAPLASLRVNLRPDSFAPIFIRFLNESLAAGPSREAHIIHKRTRPQLRIETTNRATATRNASTQIRLIITDIIDTNHQFSINNGSWTDVPANRIVTVNLVIGHNNTGVRIRDIAGNIAESSIGLWRL